MVFLLAALIGFVISFVISTITQLSTNGEVNWLTAAIDGLVGAISGALFMIPGIGPVAWGLISAGLTAVNMYITTGIENDWEFSLSDHLTIMGASILSGVIGGVTRNNFFKAKGAQLLSDNNKLISTLSKRLTSGYYYKVGSAKVAQKSISSAKSQIVKSLIKLNFSKGFYKDWGIVLLQSLSSSFFSKGLSKIL